MRRATRFALLALLALLATAPATKAGAQAARPVPVRVVGPLLAGPVPEEPILSRRAIPPLTPAQSERLRQAVAYRASGLPDRARETLLGLLAEAPHHAVLLTELARVQIAKQDFAALERLARSERLAEGDSLLLGHELTLALERLGRPRDAVATALEVWAAAAEQASWATATLLRLAPADPRGVRDAAAKAVERSPGRPDLARGLARIEWQQGHLEPALLTLARADRGGPVPVQRWAFAEELLEQAAARDSSAAIEVLLEVAGDTTVQLANRIAAARRVWDLHRARQAERGGAPRVQKALKDLPAAKWPSDLLMGVARGLRQAGLTADARALLQSAGPGVVRSPELALEQALGDLRDGPPERALPALRSAAGTSFEAAFRYAEALFFAGQPDSALAWYQRVAQDPGAAFAGAALERVYLIEDARSPAALSAFGRIAYEDWRGEARHATAIADSLYHALGRGPLWAQVALSLSLHRQAAGDARGALEPVLTVADSLPEDRLAPLARQRAGDLYLTALKDESRALAQYEECLARYPRAWNAPEVRRKLEALRRERRF